MAQCLDDGMGTSEETSRASSVVARTSTSQIFRLGRLEKAIPQIPQPQTITCRRFLEKDRQETEWIDSTRSIR